MADNYCNSVLNVFSFNNTDIQFNGSIWSCTRLSRKRINERVIVLPLWNMVRGSNKYFNSHLGRVMWGLNLKQKILSRFLETKKFTLNAILCFLLNRTTFHVIQRKTNIVNSLSVNTSVYFLFFVFDVF